MKWIGFSLLGVAILVSVLFVGNEFGILENLIAKAETEPKYFYGFVLCIQILICICVLILGSALTSYEILTGRILPKISLKQEWKNSVMGSFFLSIFFLNFAKLGYPKAEIFIICSYAFFLSKFFTIRKNKQIGLNQNEVLKKILSPQSIELSFTYLCEDVLETNQAALIFKGKIPYFSDTKVLYPKDSIFNIPDLSKLENSFIHSDIVYLDKDRSFDFVICIKIETFPSGEGYLFLGQKGNEGLFAEEEIEIAKTVSSWILNSVFLEETNTILGELQKKHIIERKISDHKTRQILHDEVLPELHSVILNLSSQNISEKNAEDLRTLTELHGKISLFLTELPDIRLELSRIGLFQVLKNLLKTDFQNSEFLLEEERDFEKNFPEFLPELQETIYYAFRESVRNAVKYSENSAQISIRFSSEQSFKIIISNSIRKTFEGPSSGQGLRIHSALLRIFGASLTLDFPEKSIAKISIEVPKTFANPSD